MSRKGIRASDLLEVGRYWFSWVDGQGQRLLARVLVGKIPGEPAMCFCDREWVTYTESRWIPLSVINDDCEFFKGEEKPDVRDVHDNGAGVPAAAGGSVDGDSVHAQPAERQLTIVSSSTVGYFTVRFDGVEAHNLSYSDVLGIVASLALPKKRISLEELGGKRIPQVAFSGY